jgi:hypothetical protein
MIESQAACSSEIPRTQNAIKTERANAVEPAIAHERTAKEVIVEAFLIAL